MKYVCCKQWSWPWGRGKVIHLWSDHESLPSTRMRKWVLLKSTLSFSSSLPSYQESGSLIQLLWNLWFNTRPGLNSRTIEGWLWCFWDKSQPFSAAEGVRRKVSAPTPAATRFLISQVFQRILFMSLHSMETSKFHWNCVVSHCSVEAKFIWIFKLNSTSSIKIFEDFVSKSCRRNLLRTRRNTS